MKTVHYALVFMLGTTTKKSYMAFVDGIVRY
jgi:hypothetical protein